MKKYIYNKKEYAYLHELRDALIGVSLPTNPTDAQLKYVGVTVKEVKEDDATVLAARRERKTADLTAAFSNAMRNHTKLRSRALDGKEIDADETANRNLQGLVTVMEATRQEKTYFCCADNSMVEVTLAQLKQMQLEIITYGQAMYAKKWEYRDAIEKAKTVAQLDAIDLDFSKVAEEMALNKL